MAELWPVYCVDCWLFRLGGLIQSRFLTLPHHCVLLARHGCRTPGNETSLAERPV